MKWCHSRHDFALRVVRGLLWPFMKIKYGFKAERMHLEKNKSYFVMANHRGFWDPFLVSFAYDRPIHFMATDNLFNNGFVSRMLEYWLAPIPKKKQGADLVAVRNAMKVSAEHGVVGVFPEGSRSYDGMPTSIDLGAASLAKKLNADIILCGLYGVYASDPRWGSGFRRGDSLIKTVRVITAEEAAEMTDEQLHGIIVEALNIEEAPSPRVVKSNKRAEKLESFFYVCPSCGKTCTIKSKGNDFCCTGCGMHGQVNEDMSLSFDNKEMGITLIPQWHEVQKKYAESFSWSGDEPIFTDENVKLFLQMKKKGSKKKLGSGEVRLYGNRFSFRLNDGQTLIIPINDVRIISPVGMKKLLITGNEDSYYIEGRNGFNCYKYAQIFFALTGQATREVK